MLFADKEHECLVKRLLGDAARKLAGDVRGFLDFNAGLMTNLSINNRMLVWVQMPHATLMEGRGKWEAKGRKVVVDEVHGINVCVVDFLKDGFTFYKTAKLFDLSQTVGENVMPRIPSFIGTEELNLILRWFAADLGCSLVRIDADPVIGTHRIALQVLQRLFVFDGCEEFDFNAAAYMMLKRYGVTKDTQVYPFESLFKDHAACRKDLKANLNRACTLYARLDQKFSGYVKAGFDVSVFEGLRKTA